MARGYLEIDGKRIELTDEQIKKLLGDKEGFNSFKRKNGETYYYIANGKIGASKENEGYVDNIRYEVANYCTNKELIKQRALHETLDRLLWRFSMENDGDKIDWSNENSKYYIYYDYRKHEFNINDKKWCKDNKVYFWTVKIAQRAINEIIIPFMEKHPEFVW